MKRHFLLMSIFAVGIALVISLITGAQPAFAQGEEPVINSACGITVTWAGRQCVSPDGVGPSHGTWESDPIGNGGVQTWTSDDASYSDEACMDIITLTLRAGEPVSFTARGTFPYADWEGATPKPPILWCGSMGSYTPIAQTFTSATGVYIPSEAEDGETRCYVGHNYSMSARNFPGGTIKTYSWEWAIGSFCEQCGPVYDPDMDMSPPMSPWSAMAPGFAVHQVSVYQVSGWNIPTNNGIHQSIVITAGTYNLIIRARSPGAGAVLQIQLGINVTALSIDSESIQEYQTLIYSDGGTQDLSFLVTSLISSVFIDSVCIADITCPLPCGMGAYDKTISNQYLRNSEFGGLDFPSGLWEVNCSVGYSIGGDVGLACSAHKEDNGLNAYKWSGSGYNADVSGVKRWHGAGACGQALGLMPPPLQDGTSQVLNGAYHINGGYNIALQMQRVYGNSRLTVCGETIDSTPLGVWTDVSFYCPDGDSQVTLLADCIGGSCASHYQGEKVVDYAAVEVDNVYIIPGKPISCTAPVVVPTLDCINLNPHLIGLSSRSDMQSGSPQTGEEENWNLSNARMGNVAAGDFAHIARLWPANGDSFIHQYVGANSETIADAEAIVPGRAYSITVSVRRFDDTDVTMDVAVGAQSPGEQTWSIPLLGPNASTIWSSGFTASSNMLNGDNLGVRVGNSGGSALIDSVCISTGGPLPPIACIGDWLSSSGGNPYDGPTPSGDYIYNAIDLAGNYRLDIEGMADSSGSLEVGYYYEIVGRPHFDVASAAVSSGAFSVTLTFPTGYSGGQLRIVVNQETTFTSVCLSKYDSPGGDGPPLPGPAPIPECLSVSSRIRTPTFYMMSPYSIATTYTETSPAYYAAELTYNYAIYPLVCTTISIANWQFDTYAQFKAAFDKMVVEFKAYYQQIVFVLWAIYDKMGQGIGGGGDLLDLLWQLFLMLLKLLLKLLALLYQMIDMFMSVFSDISTRASGTTATSYPVSCVGDAKWICLGLASIIAVDNLTGNWIEIVVLLALGCLTVGLIFWLSGQIRAIAQPGDTKSNE